MPLKKCYILKRKDGSKAEICPYKEKTRKGRSDKGKKRGKTKPRSDKGKKRGKYKKK
jgi:hypothetical protein